MILFALIYGDGANIAARLEGVAEAGGICIAPQALDQFDGKLQLTWRPLGPQILKNIPKPVDAYRPYTTIIMGNRFRSGVVWLPAQQH